MPMDVNEAARQNSEARRREAGAVLAGDASGRLTRFAALVEQSVFSTNVSVEKVVLFDAAGEVLDARRLQAAQPTPATTPSPEDVQWWARREAFEDVWEHGRRFVYGAVNAGGLGVEGRYGPYCLVVEDPRVPPPDALAVFPDNSAKRYADDTARVDAALAEAEVTAWEDRGCLAVCERRHDVGDDESQWAALVCTPSRFLEVTRAGPLPLAAVSEVRLRETFREESEDLRSRSFMGEPLTERQRRQAAAFDALHRWRAVNGTTLTSMP